ncbi:MAG TPA: DoxX family membrane protein, partial [Flavisolibacter sp.]|nr:DoxX family membrane protein [Flavisolibacter sp.]
HHPKWLDILRIALGIFLCLKGVEFATNMGAFMSLVTGVMPFSDFVMILIGHYVVFAHIMGGFLLALGLLTRFACSIQIPILMGAIIFVNVPHEMMRPFSEVFLSILILMLLIYFLIIGSGPWSLDRAIEKNSKK